jgi:hypothetical protein
VPDLEHGDLIGRGHPQGAVAAPDIGAADPEVRAPPVAQRRLAAPVVHVHHGPSGSVREVQHDHPALERRLHDHAFDLNPAAARLAVEGVDQAMAGSGSGRVPWAQGRREAGPDEIHVRVGDIGGLELDIGGNLDFVAHRRTRGPPEVRSSRRRLVLLKADVPRSADKGDHPRKTSVWAEVCAGSERIRLISAMLAWELGVVSWATTAGAPPPTSSPIRAARTCGTRQSDRRITEETPGSGSRRPISARATSDFGRIHLILPRSECGSTRCDQPVPGCCCALERGPAWWGEVRSGGTSRGFA